MWNICCSVAAWNIQHTGNNKNKSKQSCRCIMERSSGSLRPLETCENQGSLVAWQPSWYWISACYSTWQLLFAMEHLSHGRRFKFHTFQYKWIRKVMKRRKASHLFLFFFFRYWGPWSSLPRRAETTRVSGWNGNITHMALLTWLLSLAHNGEC